MTGKITRRDFLKGTAAGAITMMLPATLTGCGNSGGSTSAGEDTTFTWWIYSGAASSYYTEYQENPSIVYTLSKTWGEDEKAIALEFWAPAAGEADTNYSTMIASGDLSDIIDLTVCDPPLTMYEKGYALDITEYVEANMPNYVELVHSDFTIYNSCVTLVDGEEHYYALRTIADEPDDVFTGYMYRRDWIVKYGTNPETGKAFTGAYTNPDDQDSWEDDVVFPSGGADPIYISDWEWMFEIFETAMADLGIDDSYCISIYYPGFTWSGGLTSSFGGGTNYWYQDADYQVHFGGDEDSFRTYLECLNAWYEKGWLDPDFYQRTSDAFYAIDDTSVRQGKVGMWCGLQSELGGRLDMEDGGYTNGIFVAGAPYPINDIYGDESCQYVEPNCVMANSTVGGGVLITTAAKDKDLATLCSYLDYFYTEEGALIRTLGLNADQVAEMEDNTFYADYGMEDGAYFVNDEGMYEKSSTMANDSSELYTAAVFMKSPGLTLVANVDSGLADSYQYSIDLWSKYANPGFFSGTITTDMMTSEDTTTCSNLWSKILEYMTNNAVYFITGEKDIASDSTDWANWCKSLSKYNYQSASDIFQNYVDLYPFC
ncbi:MAG: substrate-binding domain-containing protein [Clostridiales bacterium]|nr:substrate-binding domain-containing protein [Clostridiales bacterium]